MIAAIRDAGMESRSAILSFDWRTLQVVQKEAPGIPTVYITIQTRGMDTIMADVAMPSPWTAGFQYKDHGSVPRMIKAAGGHTWSCFWANLTPAKVKEAHELGLKVLAWTVNDAPRMNQMMDMGVDGVVTDRPNLLRQEIGGALSPVRTDDLAAIPIKALMERNPAVDWATVDDVIYGCANQAGEDNRNVARMAALLAGLPVDVPGTTVNRLCGSGMDAVGIGRARHPRGEADLMIAGGVESMIARAVRHGQGRQRPSRATAQIYDTTIGWRFVNPAMKAQLRHRFACRRRPRTSPPSSRSSRADQDAFALRSQQRWRGGAGRGLLRGRDRPGRRSRRRRASRWSSTDDEHPRRTRRWRRWRS